MNNHKNIFSFNIIENRVLNEDYFILRLFSDKPLPQMLPWTILSSFGRKYKCSLLA